MPLGQPLDTAKPTEQSDQGPVGGAGLESAGDDRQLSHQSDPMFHQDQWSNSRFVGSQ
jgi:hypothetical protein